MKNFQFRFILSVISLASILMAATSSFAAPVRINQVIEIVNAKPGKAATGSFSQLRLADDPIISGDDDDDTAKATQDDTRVITETRSEIVEDDDCECADIITAGSSFPYWALGFAAIPLVFIPGRDKTPTPTPTGTTTPTVTMTTTPTETPMTPTPTKTPPTTVTPTPPEPVPEPMTILLFGTGLAGIGVAARKKFGKKEKKENEEE
ncbi:MAG: PEP-CTERM sorting domain-containing protein [Pyrinomonadaceae bacterium]